MASLHLAIIGVGLIGGSFGLAIKDALGTDVRIRGLCRTQRSMVDAVRVGAVDEAAPDLAFVVDDADVIYISTPVLQVVPMIKKMLPFVKRGAIITDAASTKGYITEELKSVLADEVSYVPGHPMTGRELSGVLAARRDLFVNKCYVLFDDTGAREEATGTIERLIHLTGANITRLSVTQHDRCASLISHVPHVTASALVTLLARSEGDLDACLALAGGGFKDTTRIASSNADMWADICMTNGENIVRHLESLKDVIDEVTGAIRRGDRDAIHSYFSAAKRQRDVILDTAGKMFEL